MECRVCDCVTSVFIYSVWVLNGWKQLQELAIENVWIKTTKKTKQKQTKQNDTSVQKDPVAVGRFCDNNEKVENI